MVRALKTSRVGSRTRCAVAAFAGLTASTHAGVARLQLQSQPGDYIGGGGTFDVVYDTDAGSLLSPQVRRTVDGKPAELLFVLNNGTGPDNTFALVFFGTDALGIPMQPGFYPDAQRADFAAPGHPGLDISFQNRGCNTITGEFTVTKAIFSDTNEIIAFEATFEQHCEGLAPALFGTFTYDSGLGGCPADFNNDGFVTGDDFDAYVVEFVAGNSSADFNNDGFVTGDDFDAFVVAFVAGC